MLKKSIVALFTRAWIEIFGCTRADTGKTVALFTRAWIEISIFFGIGMPSPVALFTRAWIEIVSMRHFLKYLLRRPLYEGVD